MNIDIPALFDYANAYSSQIKPGVIHSRNAMLTRYFERILLQRLFSVYDWELPDDWDKDYFLYVLWLRGYIAVLNTDKYGVICQQCTLSGYNVYYRPNKLIVSNPLLKTQTLTINEQAGLIKCCPDYRGVYDIISYYADMMSVIMEAFGINALNSKFSYVFASDNMNLAQSFKKMFDQIISGQPAVAVDKRLFNEDGTPRWLLFDQNLKQNFIGKDLLECMSVIDNMFCTTIGLQNSNYEKRERLLVDEVNANNQQTKALASVWMDTIQDCMEKVNKMFDLNLSIKLKEDESNANDSGIVPVRSGSLQRTTSTGRD